MAKTWESIQPDLDTWERIFNRNDVLVDAAVKLPGVRADFWDQDVSEEDLKKIAYQRAVTDFRAKHQG